MPQQWFVRTSSRILGPLSGSQLRSLADDGELSSDTLLSVNGDKWVRASRVKGLELPKEAAASPSATNHYPSAVNSRPTCEHTSNASKPQESTKPAPAALEIDLVTDELPISAARGLQPNPPSRHRHLYGLAVVGLWLFATLFYSLIHKPDPYSMQRDWATFAFTLMTMLSVPCLITSIVVAGGTFMREGVWRTSSLFWASCAGALVSLVVVTMCAYQVEHSLPGAKFAWWPGGVLVPQMAYSWHSAVLLSSHAILQMVTILSLLRAWNRRPAAVVSVASLAANVAVAFALMPTVNYLRNTGGHMTSMLNLRQLSAALVQYDASRGRLPRTSIDSADGQPLLSWRVALLPYIDQQDLYERFRLNEAWDSPHNLALLDQMPSIYASPWLTDDPPNSTRAQLITGPDTLFGAHPLGRADVDAMDGSMYTFMLAEAHEPVPWTKPIDLVYDAQGPLPRFGWSADGAFRVATAGGLVRIVRPNTKESAIRARVTPNGGETLSSADGIEGE